jgi:hypothetical protein
MEFGETDDADSQLARNWRDIGGDKDAGVQNAAAHRSAQGSTREPSS